MKRFRSNFLCSMFAFSAFLGSFSCANQAFADDPPVVPPCSNWAGTPYCWHQAPWCSSIDPAKTKCEKRAPVVWCNCYA